MDFGVVCERSLHFYFTQKKDTMKKTTNVARKDIEKLDAAITCGNCWGHQKYQEDIVDVMIDVRRGRRDNFISRFVKKYLSNK